MQTTGEGIRTARSLVEFAASVQTGEDDFDRRHFFFRVQSDRDTTAIVFDADAAILVQGDEDVLAMTAKRFVGGIVDDFLDDV